MAKSYLYPRKKKKFTKIKTTLLICILLILVLMSFYFYKTTIKNQTIVFQSPVVFVEKDQQKKTLATPSRISTFKENSFEISKKQIVENNEANSQNKVIVFDLTITNNSKKDSTFSDNDFTLVQGGTHFTGNMSGLTDKETFNSEVIKPKTTLTRSIAFSVPANIAEKNEFDLIISNDNWANQQTTIHITN